MITIYAEQYVNNKWESIDVLKINTYSDAAQEVLFENKLQAVPMKGLPFNAIDIGELHKYALQSMIKDNPENYNLPKHY